LSKCSKNYYFIKKTLKSVIYLKPTILKHFSSKCDKKLLL
jgi:hypothetical protein